MVGAATIALKSSKTPEGSPPPRFWSDGRFWLAVAAAPVCWWLMLTLGVPRRTDGPTLSAVLLIVLVNPVLEEIVFRGGLQDWLQKQRALQHRWGALSLANIVTSLLFASMHLFRQPPLWAALIFLPSLVFGWAKERHATLLSPILLHVSYNAGFIWLFA